MSPEDGGWEEPLCNYMRLVLWFHWVPQIHVLELESPNLRVDDICRWDQVRKLERAKVAEGHRSGHPVLTIRCLTPCEATGRSSLEAFIRDLPAPLTVRSPLHSRLLVLQQWKTD